MAKSSIKLSHEYFVMLVIYIQFIINQFLVCMSDSVQKICKYLCLRSVCIKMLPKFQLLEMATSASSMIFLVFMS